MVGFSTTKYNQVFTARLHYSPVIPAHVTLCAVTDSGRYFVLKITNAQGKHAFIGMYIGLFIFGALCTQCPSVRVCLVASYQSYHVL